KTQYYLTTAAPGVGGTIAPASTWYDSGTQVQVRGTPNTNYVFSSFTGALTGGANPQTLTISAPPSVTANFAFAPVGYGYYYTDPLTSISANWTQNGVLSAGGSGLTSADSSGGALI